MRNPYALLLRARPCELAVVLKWCLRMRRRKFLIGGTKRLWLDPASNLGANLLANDDYEPVLSRCLHRPCEQVTVLPIDYVAALNCSPSIHFAKVDVEGFKASVLRSDAVSLDSHSVLPA